MSRPDPAIRVALPDLHTHAQTWTGLKVRTVGFLTAADPASSIGVLAVERGAIVLDLSLCLEEGVYLPRIKTKLDCMGEIEPVDVESAMVANALLNDHVSAMPRPANRIQSLANNPAQDSEDEVEHSVTLSGSVAPEGQHREEAASEIAPVVLRCIHFRCVDELDVRAWNDAARVLQAYAPAAARRTGA
ncbi:hypothetical protein OC835_006108 [Tilletia horrida]|nr:hypothetical protein OC835_006108 [Tilletia horrida]